MSSAKPTYTSAFLSIFGRNYITMLGGMVAAISGIMILGLLLLQLLGLTDSPYAGIVAFMILPGFFVFGLLIIPAGVLWERFKLRKNLGKETVEGPLFPIVDLNNPHTRHVAAVITLLTVFNLLIISAASYHGLLFMDSVPFCGKVCHTVMEPEYTAYSHSPHLRVRCVECHIGPGASWFVRSKISGAGQVLAVLFNSYPKPIPSPVENLRPSRETCEQCHWPEKFSGDRLKVITHFKDDETNTASKTVLLMHIGGGGNTANGIHSWHISPDKRTYYKAIDKERQKMGQVRVVRKDGTESLFRAPEDKVKKEDLARAEERQMDCIDCHNRPSHIFKMPATEVDAALADGRIDVKLPYIKKLGVDVLTETKCSEDDLSQIEQKVRAFYNEKYASLVKDTPALVDGAVRALQGIYKNNVFPKMGLNWGAHPNNLGHEQFPGCFRCHDDSMQDKDGKTVGQDCTICHSVLAWDEADPEILQKLGQ